MSTIREFVGKIKHRALGALFLPLLIALVGFASFGLGRLSALEYSRPDVRISMPATVAESASAGGERSVETASGSLVASQNSTKYHYPWCSGAQRIAERNKIWFDSADEARAAGYEPAANCAGLE